MATTGRLWVIPKQQLQIAPWSHMCQSLYPQMLLAHPKAPSISLLGLQKTLNDKVTRTLTWHKCMKVKLWFTCWECNKRSLTSCENVGLELLPDGPTTHVSTAQKQPKHKFVYQAEYLQQIPKQPLFSHTSAHTVVQTHLCGQTSTCLRLACPLDHMWSTQAYSISLPPQHRGRGLALPQHTHTHTPAAPTTDGAKPRKDSTVCGSHHVSRERPWMGNTCLLTPHPPDHHQGSTALPCGLHHRDHTWHGEAAQGHPDGLRDQARELTSSSPSGWGLGPWRHGCPAWGLSLEPWRHPPKGSAPASACTSSNPGSPSRKCPQEGWQAAHTRTTEEMGMYIQRSILSELQKGSLWPQWRSAWRAMGSFHRIACCPEVYTCTPTPPPHSMSQYLQRIQHPNVCCKP